MSLLWMSTKIQKINIPAQLIVELLLFIILKYYSHTQQCQTTTTTPHYLWLLWTFIHKQKSILHITSLLRYVRNLSIWLVEIIFGQNARSRILQKMGFVMGSLCWQEFSFQKIFKKIWKFLEKYKIQYFLSERNIR